MLTLPNSGDKMGQKYTVPARNYVHFKPSSALNEEVKDFKFIVEESGSDTD